VPKNKKDKILSLFGSRVFKIRTHQKISRVQLAFEINTDEKHIRLIEKGEINTGILNAYKIAQVLNVKVGTLFEEE
jgi:ribosome-binding protein aMBF1 (putative translation factor)